jgi:hypothetical protein
LDAQCIRGDDARKSKVLLESQNPHLPAASAAGLLSREVTGEVTFASLRITEKKF